jgi:DNA-binding transcriptional regulator/RsmH inhibitor MraZ
MDNIQDRISKKENMQSLCPSQGDMLYDCIVYNGFFWGEYEVTVDCGPRIRLPKSILDVLRKHKIKEIWRYPAIMGHGVILCPDRFQKEYINLILKQIEQHPFPQDAYRMYICAGECISLNSSGRISITKTCNDTFRIKSGDQIVILGTGMYYEMWPFDEWNKKTQSVLSLSV